jgi:spoIIIJ-associated protein
VDEQDAEVEVIEEPKAGLFGRLRSEARVRARVRPTHPRPKGDREARPRRRGGGGSQGHQRGERQERRPAQERAAPVTANVEDGGGGNGRQDRDVPLAEQAEVARQFLEGLMSILEMPASVDVREVDEETVELGVTGQELGLLIGPRGATLNALQDLTRTVVNRRTGGRNGRLLVDVAGYREKRKVALERFIREVAAEVKNTGTPKGLEPMSPADRKIVHDTVNAIEGVTTSSEGEEPRRRVVIVPT